jgi:hypothetical protein
MELELANSKDWEYGIEKFNPKIGCMESESKNPWIECMQSEKKFKDWIYGIKNE